MQLPEGTLTVHFHVSVRVRCLHPDLGLHVWGPAVPQSSRIPKTRSKAGLHGFGESFQLKLAKPSTEGTMPSDFALGLSLKEGDQAFGQAELNFSQLAESKEIWIVNDRVLLKEPDPTMVPVGDFHQQKARAHWLSSGCIALRFDWYMHWHPKQKPMHFWTRSEDTQFQFFLHASGAELQDCGSDGVQGGQCWKLTPQQRLAAEDLTNTNVPFLAGCLRLTVPKEVDPREVCKQKLAVSIRDTNGKPVDCTGVQIGPVIDELFAYDGPLGCSSVSGVDAKDSANSMEFALWAPSAVKVDLILTEDPFLNAGKFLEEGFSESTSKVSLQPMHRRLRSADDGVWRCRGTPDCWGKFYVYRIYAYHPSTGKFQTTVTPDPYSNACAADASWSMVCYLPTWKEVLPDDVKSWCDHSFLPLQEDAAIYELHVRDFSMSDPKVSQPFRGKYLAFAEENSLGNQHLRQLAESGISHVQLLPTYDFGSVPENLADRVDPPTMDLQAADAEEPQEAIAEVADRDSFNWGYDPVLYNVPEGSYASNPNNGSRIKEFREMISALHKKKLGVVMDVVFNHTLGSGPENPKSVLDKCVPGYYHRRAEDGSYEHSTCANNTATERYMMGRLVCDSVLHWVTQYQVDGFRFDLMGHIPLKVMRKVRDLLDSLRLDMHGIDGHKIMLYGEGWEFGEVANGQRGQVAVQQQLAGSRIGAFNDRIRDATLGGSPFTDPRLQSFATGLLMKPITGGPDQGSVRDQETRLRKAQDTIRISLAGSLKEFSFQNFHGETRQGDQHFNEALAYTDQPVEAINYVSAHDNETLFDNSVWKMPPGCFSPTERMRGNWLATSLVALAHGVPFFHAGDELLRSKSLDRDSYNSGDWFNVLDFSGEKSAFGVGLPPKGKNGHHWDMMRPLLRDSEVRPTVEMVEATKAKFCELLRLRRSTALIGLHDAKHIKEKVNFPGCGPLQKLGLIVMQICNDAPDKPSPMHCHYAPDKPRIPRPMLCSSFARVVIVFWAGFETAKVPVPRADPRLNGGKLPLRLHPLQQESQDSMTRDAHLDGEHLVIPPQTTAVFVEPLDADPK